MSLERLFDPPRVEGAGGGGRRHDGCDAVLHDVARSVATRSPAFAERFEVVLLGDGRDSKDAGGDLVAQAAALLAMDFSGCMSRTMLAALIWRRSATTFKLRALAVVERCGSNVVAVVVAGFAVATPEISAEIVFLSTTVRLRRCGFGSLLACCVAEGARELGLSALHVAAASDTIGYWRRMRLGGELGGFTESPAGTLAIFTAFGARFQGVAMMRAALPQISGAAVAQGVRGLTLRVFAPAAGVCEIESSVGLEEALCSLQLVTCAAAVPLPVVAAAEDEKEAVAAAAAVAQAKGDASALCSLQRVRSIIDIDAGAALHKEGDAEAARSSAIALRWRSFAKLLRSRDDAMQAQGALSSPG